MDELYISKAGNVVEAIKRANGDVYFDRVGIIDENGDSRDLADGRWAVMPETWLTSAVKGGCMIPAVRMMGGSWMPESEYVEIMIHRAESRAARLS